MQAEVIIQGGLTQVEKFTYTYIYMALDGDENHADQARYKAMCLTAFRSDAFGRVPKRWPFLWGWSYFPAMSQ